MAVLDNLARIVASVMGESLFRAATLHAKSGAINSCRALVTEYKDFLRLRNGIPAKDRNVLILGDTIATPPKTGDVVVIDGEAWSIIVVKVDPANATYECQSSPARMPVGDATAIEDGGLLASMPTIIFGAMGSSLFKSALVYTVTGRASDGRGGYVPTYAETVGRALITEFTDDRRGADDIPSKDRRALILSASIPGIVVKAGDIVYVDEGAWVFVNVASDPAGATFDGQASPARIPSVGRTGRLAVTLQGFSVIATGRATIQGAAAIQLANATSTGSGASAITGQAAIVIDGATLVATGNFPIHGALASTLGNVTLAATGSPVDAGAGGGRVDDWGVLATGSPVIQGAAAITLANATSTGLGYQPITGALAVTLGNATLFSEAGPSGSLASTLGAFTVVSAGYQRDAGALAITLGDATLSSAGKVGTNGSLSSTLGNATLIAGGVATIGGSLALTLADASLTGSGSPRIEGSMAATLAGATGAGAGYQRNAGALAITLGDATLVATSASSITGAAAITLGDVTSVSNGSPIDVGAGAGVVADAILSSAGYQRNAGALAITTGDASLTSAGKVGTNGALAVTLANATGSGAGYQLNIAALASTLADVTASAAGKVGTNGALAVTLANTTAISTGYQTNAGALAATLAAATLSATGTVKTNGALASTLANATLSAAGSIGASNTGALAITLANVTASATGEPRVRAIPQLVGSLVGNKAGATSGDTTVNFSSLTGGLGVPLRDGDLVLVAYATGSTADRTLRINDGTTDYTLIASELYANGTTNDTNLRFAYKFMGPTPDTSVLIGPTGNAADGGAWAIHVWRGVDTTTPLDATATTATGTATSRPDPPSITPVTTNAVVVVATGGSAATGTTAFTFASANNLVQDNGVDTQDGRASLASYTWSSGALNPAAAGAGAANAADSWGAISIALRPMLTTTNLGAAAVATANATLSAGGTVGAGSITAPTFVASAVAFDNSNIVTCNKPTGVTSGDLLVACCTYAFANSTDTWILPSGWAEVGTQGHDWGDGNTSFMFYKIAGGSEPSSYTFENAGGFTGCGINAFRGVDQTTPFGASSKNQGTNATRTATGITTGQANSLLLMLSGGGATKSTDPSGFTQAAYYDDPGGITYYKTQATAGASGNVTHTQGSSAIFACQLVEIKGV